MPVTSIIVKDATAVDREIALPEVRLVQDDALGGVSAAAAGDTGAATTNGFLRWLRDKFVAGITLALGGAPVSSTNPLPVAGKAVIVGGSFSRPADTTTYAIGDLIANSTAAGSVVPITIAASRVADATGMVRKLRLSTAAAWAGKTVRVHLFKNSPVVATAGDNGALATNVAGIAAVHLGFADITLDQTFSDGCKGEGVPNIGSEFNFDPATGTPNIYALLEARGADTPASGQTFVLAAEVLQN